MPAPATIFPPFSPHRLHRHREGIFRAQTSVSDRREPNDQTQEADESDRMATVWCMRPAARDSKRQLLVSARATCAPHHSPLVACGKKYLPQNSTKHTGFFFLPLHALTCRHPCQRGGARGSHARVDLGDLLTARMSGAGRAGRGDASCPSLHWAGALRLCPSCSRSRRGQTCRLSLLGRACSISWRALSGVMSHISAQDRPVRGSMSRRLGMKLGLGLRMRRRCGDGGGGAAVCSRRQRVRRQSAPRSDGPVRDPVIANLHRLHVNLR
jgi:hypothetical protein